ncbi:hypothetical protein PACTADRAFT_41023 [Pachysolen tannophilus NRRL Y-2460]|uniref:5'-deoxynucleotidase n=1 Tax=Pachysolen tannophilus NRRL Y-2460 TaxID=669874 RepID=A0A1E4TWJ6_PACTA|nr:hypothetical protein PACTADRAFT_41023 [Pachysolen tannophilus NRRL Y-2460]
MTRSVSGSSISQQPQNNNNAAASSSSSSSSWNPESAVPLEIKQLLIPKQTTSSSYSYILAFHQILDLLKSQKRTGWLNHNISNPESISDHMYRMSIIAMSLNSSNFPENNNEKLDLSKCVKISLIHDIAEALVGDIVPHDTTVNKEEKNKREYNTILYMSQLIKNYNPIFAQEIIESWLDYEEQRNFEAKIVKDIDKYELLLSAFHYEREYKGEKDLSEFFSARELIKTQEIAKIADELLKERDLFWRNIKKIN